MSYRRSAALLLAAGLPLSHVPLVGAQVFASETFTLASGSYPTTLVGANTVSSGFSGPWATPDPVHDSYILTGPQAQPLVLGLASSNATATNYGAISRTFDVGSAAFDGLRAATPDSNGGAAIGAANTSLWVAFTVGYGTSVVNFADANGVAFGAQVGSFGPDDYYISLAHGGFSPAISPARGDNQLVVFNVAYHQADTRITAYVNPPAPGSGVAMQPSVDVTLPADSEFASGLRAFNRIDWSSDGSGSILGALRVGATYADVAPTYWSYPNTWTGGANGSWNEPANWSGPVPDGVDSSATLGSSATPRTIQLTGDAAVATLTFDSDSPYTITGGGNLTTSVAAVVNEVATTSGTVTSLHYEPKARTINVLRGSHVIDAAVTGSGSVTVNARAGTFISIKTTELTTPVAVTGGGTVTIAEGIKASFGTPVSVDGGSTLIAESTDPGIRAISDVDLFNGDVPNVTVGAGSRLEIRAPGTAGDVFFHENEAAAANFTVAGLVVVAPPTADNAKPLVVVSTVNPQFGPDGKIDLTTNVLLVRSPDFAGLSADLAAGHYYTSLPPVTGAETLALAQQQYDGDGNPLIFPLYVLQNQTNSDIYAAAFVYTYFGDTNLDGAVNADDFANLEMGLASAGSLAGWYWGDFNNDGVIDATDVSLFALGMTNQGRTLGFNATAVVPEPVTAAPLAAPAMLLRRRRRAS